MRKRLAHGDLSQYHNPAALGRRQQLAGGGLPMELLLLGLIACRAAFRSATSSRPSSSTMVASKRRDQSLTFVIVGPEAIRHAGPPPRLRVEYCKSDTAHRHRGTRMRAARAMGDRDGLRRPSGSYHIADSSCEHVRAILRELHIGVETIRVKARLSSVDLISQAMSAGSPRSLLP